MLLRPRPFQVGGLCAKSFKMFQECQGAEFQTVACACIPRALTGPEHVLQKPLSCFYQQWVRLVGVLAMRALLLGFPDFWKLPCVVCWSYTSCGTGVSCTSNRQNMLVAFEPIHIHIHICVYIYIECVFGLGILHQQSEDPKHRRELTPPLASGAGLCVEAAEEGDGMQEANSEGLC